METIVWPEITERVIKVLEEISKLNDKEYTGKVYNPEPFPGWCPEMKHFLYGFIRELEHREGSGGQIKIDVQSLRELFDIIIEISSGAIEMNCSLPNE